MNEIPEPESTIDSILLEILLALSDLVGLGLVEMAVLMYVGIGIGAIARLIQGESKARTY